MASVELFLIILKGPIGNDTRTSRRPGLFLSDGESPTGILFQAICSNLEWIVDKHVNYEPSPTFAILLPVRQRCESVSALSSILDGVPVRQDAGYSSLVWVENALQALAHKGCISGWEKFKILRTAKRLLKGEDDAA